MPVPWLKIQQKKVRQRNSPFHYFYPLFPLSISKGLSLKMERSIIRAEIAAIKNKLQKLKTAIKQEEKKKERLKADAISKFEQITLLEESISQQSSAYNIEKYEIIEDIKSKSFDFEKIMSELRLKQSQLMVSLAPYEYIHYDHQHLLSVLEKERKDLQILENMQKEEVQRRVQHNFDITLRFDQIIREKVLELYLEKHQQLAVNFSLFDRIYL